MKSISFDQIKTMLKSISHAIFKRLGNVSNRVDAVEKKVNTFKQPKTIIIERDSALNNGTATSGTPFDEAWAMSDAELTASIVVTTKSFNHVYVSSSVVSVEHIKAGDEEMLRIITNDYYDGSKGEYHHNEINWYKANGANVFDRKAFITVERYHIAELMNKTNSFTLTQDGSLDIATMSETEKGGAKVGEGLEVVDGKLRVKPEGEYELIDIIALGYERLTEKPEDWETNWGNYYEATAGLLNVVASYRAWEPWKYFKSAEYVPVSQIVINKEPDETPFNFRKMYIDLTTPKSDSKKVGVVNVNQRPIVYNAGMLDAEGEETGAATKVFCEIDGGIFTNRAIAGAISGGLGWTNANQYLNGFAVLNQSDINYMNVTLLNGVTFPEGTVLKIYGVRNNA